MATTNEKILSKPLADWEIDPRGVGCAIFEKMLKHGDKVALLEGVLMREHTYDSILQNIVRVASNLRKIGVKQGDSIAFFDHDTLTSIVLILAIFFVGAVPVPFAYVITREEATGFLNYVEPKLVFSSRNNLEIVENVLRSETNLNFDIILLDDDDDDDDEGKSARKYKSFGAFLEKNEEDFEPVPCKSLDDTAIMMFSSGTSGRHKAIPITHYSLLYQLQACNNFPIQRLMHFSHFSWVTQVLFTFSSLYFGYCKITFPIEIFEDFWSYVNKTQPTSILMGTWRYANIRGSKPPNFTMKSIRAVMGLGHPMNDEAYSGIRALFPDAAIFNLYGMTETAGAVTCFRYDDPHERILQNEAPKSIGLVAAGMSIKVVDPSNEGVSMGTGQTGELRIKSKLLLKSYYKLDSRECFDQDGWYRTGDLCYYDEKHRFFVDGRISDLIAYRDRLLYPLAIEEILLQHPDVLEGVVFAVPDEIDGNLATAMVILKNPGKKVDPATLREFVDDRVSDNSYRLRGGVKIVDAIPKNYNGKYLRKNCTALVVEGKI